MFTDLSRVPFRGTIDGVFITPGAYRPGSPLSVFEGQPWTGTWTLTVADCCDPDTGVIENFSIGGIEFTGTCDSRCPACSADYNQDGGVDGSDIEAFFTEWTAGTGCADVNQDGGVDGTDLESFFIVWQVGGC